MIHCGIKEATRNKIAECLKEPVLSSLEGKRYEDIFLFSFILHGHREEAGPDEKTVAEEGEKVKNQDTVDLGIYEVAGEQGQMERQPQYWPLLLLILSPAQICLPGRPQQKTHYLLLFQSFL